VERKLNLNKLKNRPYRIISSEEALKNVTLFNWSNEVLNGRKKIIIK